MVCTMPFDKRGFKVTRVSSVDVMFLLQSDTFPTSPVFSPPSPAEAEACKGLGFPQTPKCRTQLAGVDVVHCNFTEVLYWTTTQQRDEQEAEE